MTRMNWSRPVHRTHGKRTLSIRDEQEVEDRALRWLRAVERRRQQRRTTTVAPSSGIAIQRQSTR